MKSFDSTPFDWYNFVAQDCNSNALIQMVLHFAAPLDFRRLQQAMACCTVADPVLGCFFDVDSTTPRWREARAKQLEAMCVKVRTDCVAYEVDQFLARRLDAVTECPVKVALVCERSGGACVLVAKVHHALCDAAGALQFVRLLGEMYSQLARDASYMPRSGVPARGTAPFYEFFGMEDSLEAKKARADMSLLTNFPCTWGAPAGSSDGGGFAYRTVTFSAVKTQGVLEYTRSAGVSVNDVLLAAYHRSLVKVLRPDQAEKEVQFTANLRKYAREGAAAYSICNFSNTYTVNLPVGGSFDRLVAQTARAVAEVLEPEKVLQSVLVNELMSTDYKALVDYYTTCWEDVVKTGLCTPMISNLGRINDLPVAFDGAEPAAMYVVSPAFKGPSFMLCASTYKGQMTLCAAYDRGSTADGFVEGVLEEMDVLASFLRL